MEAVREAPRERSRTLAERAHQVRRNAIRMAEVQGQGYIAQALGVADVLAVTYLHAMKVRPKDPMWEGRDRFLLSVGHYAIAHYAILAEAGYFSEDELVTYGCDDSRLPMSGMTSYTPGAEMSGGSIGMGLPMAVGMGLGLKKKGSSSFIYTLMGDGEMAEGPTWEAAAVATNYKLDNIIGLVDFNGVQADGPSMSIMRTEPLVAKFEAFGCYVQRVNGNDLGALTTAFDNARNHPRPVPRIIICDTKMGRGVDFLEKREKNHFIRLEPQDWKRAYAALEAGRNA